MNYHKNKNSISLAILLTFTMIITGCGYFSWQRPQVGTTKPIDFDPQIENRGWPAQEVLYANVSVTHRPLYFTSSDEYVPGPRIIKNEKIQNKINSRIQRLTFEINLILFPVAAFIDPPRSYHISRSNEPIQSPVFEILEN